MFLSAEGLATSDYHPSYEDVWTANSKVLKIGEDVWTDNLTYYVKGSEHSAKQLALELHVNSSTNLQKSDQRFLVIAQKLLVAALRQTPSEELLTLLSNFQLINIQEAGRRITLERENYARHAEEGYSRTLTISCISD